MRLTTATVLAALTLGIGLVTDEGPIWIPASVLVAAVIDLFTRSWTTSTKLGSAVVASAILKLICSMIGTYATLGQVACIVLLGWWLIF